MIDETHSFGLLKVGQYKWVKLLYDGEVSFSCARSYIRQAKLTGNNEQGDSDEAVFARLKKGDSRIHEMSLLLGRDLETIDDGDYLKLRRKSSCFIPIFCIYSIFVSDFQNQLRNLGNNKVRIDIPAKIYDGFLDSTSIKNVLSNDYRISGVFLQPRPFVDGLMKQLNGNYAYRSKRIDYELQKNAEFFIEPTDAREELFYKRPQYEYQHEARFILHHTHFSNVFERLNIQTIPLDDADRHFLYDSFYITANVKTELKK